MASTDLSCCQCSVPRRRVPAKSWTSDGCHDYRGSLPLCREKDLALLNTSSLFFFTFQVLSVARFFLLNMKATTVAVALLAAAADAKRVCTRPTAGPPGACNTGRCLRAINSIPALGEAFCSSWLGVAPSAATTIVTETATETATATATETTTESATSLFIETSTTVVSVTTGTTTVTEGATTVFQRRAVPSVPSVDEYADILSGCRSVSTRISSACSCFLKESTTGAVLVSQTTTATTTVTETGLQTETTTEVSATTVNAPCPPPPSLPGLAADTCARRRLSSRP